MLNSILIIVIILQPFHSSIQLQANAISEKITSDFQLQIISRENDLNSGQASIEFKVINENESINIENKKFTVFIFFGDNLYTSYEHFSSEYSNFPTIKHLYRKPGKYKPLLVVYSENLQDKTFRFSDEINVEISQGEVVDEEVLEEKTINPYDSLTSAQDLKIIRTKLTHEAPLLNAKPSYEIISENENTALSSKKFTIFLFWGDKLYRNYEHYTGIFNEIPKLSYSYTQPGVYRPIFIAYSKDLKDRVFKILDPIVVTRNDNEVDKPIAIGHMNNRFDSIENNIVNIDFDSEGSFDPTTNTNEDLSYLWNFGDGNIISTKEIFINHTYTSAGLFTPSLKVISSDHRESEEFYLPQIEISKKVICYEDRNQWFNIGSCQANCGLQQGLQHQKNLCEEDRHIQCISKACASNRFNILNEHLEAPGYISFIAFNDGFDSDEALTYKFIIEDGNGETQEQIYKTSSFYFPNPGEYNVKLEINEKSYLASTYSETISVKELNKPPVAKVTTDNHIGEIPFTVIFDASTSYDPELSKLNYNWNFGDGTLINNGSEIISHTYTQIGEYKVELTVKDERGFTNKAQIPKITAEEKNFPPTADFNLNPDDCPWNNSNNQLQIKQTLRANNTFYCNLGLDASSSTDPNFNISSYDWYISDENQNQIYHSNNIKDFYKFEKYGDYNIQLVVKDIKGESDNLSYSIKILEPDPIIKATTVSREDFIDNERSVVSFSAEGSFVYSNNPDDPQRNDGVEFEWDFGDGSTGYGKEVTHEYSPSGVYTPSIKLCDGSCHSDNILGTKTIESIFVEKPIPLISSITLSNISGLEDMESSVQYKTIGQFQNEAWNWNYKAYDRDQDGNTILVDKSSELNQLLESQGISFLDSPQHFTEAGQYELIRTLDGKKFDSETLTVLPNQIPVPKIKLSHSQGSNHVTVSAEESYDPKSYKINSYTWDWGDNSPESHGITAEHTYITPGRYLIKLTVVDTKGLSSSALTRFIQVGNTEIIEGIAPLRYILKPDFEADTENLETDEFLLPASEDDPVNEYDLLKDKPNATTIQQPRLLDLMPSDLSPGGSNTCTAAFTKEIKINNLKISYPIYSEFKTGTGGKLVEIHGSNFCEHNRKVLIRIPGGSFETRPVAYRNPNLLITALQAKDLKDSSFELRVRQRAINGNYYNDTHTQNLLNNTPAAQTLEIIEGNSVGISLINNPSFSITQGGDFHYFHPSKGPLLFGGSNKMGAIESKNIRIKHPAGLRAKLALNLNGNWFDSIKAWVNGKLVLNKDPDGDAKFSQIISNEFFFSDLDDGVPDGNIPFNIRLEVSGPGNAGFAPVSIDLVSSPKKPTLKDLKLSYETANKDRKKVILDLSTTPNTVMFAAHINRATTSGEKHKILDVKRITSDSSGHINFNFRPTKLNPGTHYIVFYFDNGSVSDEKMKTEMKSKIIQPFNRNARENKSAFISALNLQAIINHALNVASFKHAEPFNNSEKFIINLSNNADTDVQVNNQVHTIDFSTTANGRVSENLEYFVSIFDGETPETSSIVEEFNGSSASFIVSDKFLKGNEDISTWNMKVYAEYLDDDIFKNYYSELSEPLRFYRDKSPVAKINTVNPEKLILQASDSTNEKAEFNGSQSFDPVKETMPSINDGIGSYNWSTEFQTLSNNAENFILIPSIYSKNSNRYFIGPSKTPGIYRATLNVHDYHGNSDSAYSDTVQITRPGQKIVASFRLLTIDKIHQPDSNGTKELAFKASVRPISPESNPLTELNYIFDFGDGITENGSINVSDIILNEFIGLSELTDRRHIYSEGEYEPKFTISGKFTNGESESWTVRAGTITVKRLPNTVIFSPKIFNYDAFVIASPGFKAQLGVVGKQILNTELESFGWDFGDGTSWTYSGNNPTNDFLKDTFTNFIHQYNDLGVYQLKFWVKTIDEVDPITYSLSPLVIQNIGAPEISFININQKSTNVVFNDEQIISVTAGIVSDPEVNVGRVDLIIKKRNSGAVLYNKHFLGDYNFGKFNKDIKDLYLEPGNYLLEITPHGISGKANLVGITKSINFEVRRAKGENRAIDINNLNNLSSKKNIYIHDEIFKLPIKVLKRIKGINIYVNSVIQEQYQDVLDDYTRYSRLDDSELEEEFSPADITTNLEEGVNKVQLEAILYNGKIIKSKELSIIVDSTDPAIEIETPAPFSQYSTSKLILSGEIIEENIDKVFYRINNSGFKILPIKVDEEDSELYSFELALNLEKELKNEFDNFIEVLVIDKAGNRNFEHSQIKYLGNGDESLKRVNLRHNNGESYTRGSGKSDHGNYTQCYPDYLPNLASVYDSHTGAVLPFGVSGFQVPQAKPFDVNFLISICDDSELGTEQTKVSFLSINPDIAFSNNQGENRLFNLGSSFIFSSPHILRRPLYTHDGLFVHNVISRGGDLDDGISAIESFLYTTGFNSKINGDSRLSFDYGNFSDIWNVGAYRFSLNSIFNINQIIGDGTIVELQSNTFIEIIPGEQRDAIEIKNLKTVPEELLRGHNIDQLDMVIDVSSITPINSSSIKIYQARGAYEEELTYDEHKLTFSQINSFKDTFGNYRKVYKIQAINLPRIIGSAHHFIRIKLQSNDSFGDLTLNRKNAKLKILELPEKFIFINVSEIFDDESRRKKEENTVSLNTKKFKLVVHHINDNGLTRGDYCKSCSPETSEILSNLTITKYIDDYNYTLNGDEMSFRLLEESIDSPKYPGYHKTVYESIGPDNGGTIFKDMGDLVFNINLSTLFAEKLEQGFIFNPNSRDQFDIKAYELKPYPIDLEDIKISTEELLFEPDLSFITNTSNNKIRFHAGDFHYQGTFEYDEKLTARFDPSRFSYEQPHPSNPKKLATINPGLRFGNAKHKTPVKFDILGEDNNISIENLSGDKYHFSIPINIALEDRKNILLKNPKAANPNSEKNVQIPFAIVTKSESDLDVEIKGILDSSEVVVKFIDYPIFDDPKSGNPNPRKITYESNNKVENLILNKAFYSNIVNRNIDPLEIELTLFNEYDFTIGSPLIINGGMIGKTSLSNIKSKHRSVLNKINLTKHASSEFKKYLEDAEYVTLKLRSDRNYLEDLIGDKPGLVDYYHTVHESDPLRFRKVNIESGLKNKCQIIYEGFPRQNKTHTIVASNSDDALKELNKVKISFESASKKGARIWIKDAEPNNLSAKLSKDHNFGGLPFSVENFDSAGEMLELNPLQNKVLDSRKGIFDFDNFIPPTDDRKEYFINFIVAKRNADPSVFSPFEGKVNQGVSCGIQVIKGIGDADIIFNPLNESNIIHRLPKDSHLPVQISTNPLESIVGVSLYVGFEQDGKNYTIDLPYIDQGAYKEINMSNFVPGKIVPGKEYRLIAKLDYIDFQTEQRKSKTENRRIIFVDEKEPIAIFGDDNDVGNDNGSHFGPNIVVAQPYQDYVFNRDVTVQGLNPINASQMDFKLIDRSENKTKDLNKNIKSTTENSVIYNVETNIPFNSIDDIKEYSLQAYKNNIPLSSKLDFLIIDDPEFHLEGEDFTRVTENTLQASSIFKASITNGFARDIAFNVTSFKNNNPENGILDLKESSSINSHEADLKLDLIFSDSGNNSNFVLTSPAAITLAIPVAVAAPPAAAVGIVAIGAVYLLTNDDIRDRISDQAKVAAQYAFTKFSNIREYAFGDSFFAIEILRNGQLVSRIAKDNADYKLKIRSSSNKGTLIISDLFENSFVDNQVINLEALTDIDEYDFPGDLNPFPIPSYNTLIEAPELETEQLQVTVKKFTHIPDPGSKQQNAPKYYPFVSFGMSLDHDDNKDPCVYRELRKLGVLIPDIAIGQFVISAIKEAVLLQGTGIKTTETTTYKNITPGYILLDLNSRIFPQSEGIGGVSSHAAQGYCESIAEHIKHKNSRPGLFRLFEARDHRDGEDKNNYHVYWLSSSAMRHILERHGHKSPFEDATKFHKEDDIIHLLGQTILGAEKKGVANKNNPNYANDTAFQKFFSNKQWASYSKSGVFQGYSSNLQVRTSTNSYYRIETGFPLKVNSGSEL